MKKRGADFWGFWLKAKDETKRCAKRVLERKTDAI